MATSPHSLTNNTAAADKPVRDCQVALLSKAEVSDPAFVSEWKILARVAAEPNPFFEPALLLPALEHFSARGSVEVLAVRVGNLLCGLMPLATSPSYYGYPVPHFTTWLHANAFCGVPLVAQGLEHAFWRAVLESRDETRGKALFLHLPQLPSEGPVAASLAAVLEQQQRQSAIVQSIGRAMLRSESTADEYLHSSLTPKRRKELRRLKKRFGELGELEFERQNDRTSAPRWIEEFLELEHSSWKGTQGSAFASSPTSAAYFRQAMLMAAQAGTLERLAFRLDGHPIAMLANLVAAPGVFSFKTTFDEAYAKYSPGFLLQLENLELLDRSEIAWADSCAAEGHPMIERLWREKRRIQAINVAIGGPIRRAMFKQLMRRETRRKGIS